MASTIISPNMALPIPVAGVQTGPDYALNEEACFTLIDGHDHSAGKGVQITPSGLNINSDLTFLSNNAISLRSSRYVSQSVVLSGPSDLLCVYSVGADLYFNDGVGNNVRITQGGAVAGSPGSIANLTSPASASYVSGSKTFVWQSDANTPANMDNASVILRNLVANSFGLTLSPPNAMASDTTIVLPTLPASQKIVTLDNSGNMAAVYDVDNVTLDILSNNLEIKNLGVSTGKIADGAVTQAKLAAVPEPRSSSCGTFNTTSSSYVAVTNLSVTFVSTGRPAIFGLIADSTNNPAFVQIATPTNDDGLLAFLIDAAFVSQQLVPAEPASGPAISLPVSAYSFLTVPGPGTYTISVQVKVTGGSTLTVANALLYAIEL